MNVLPFSFFPLVDQSHDHWEQKIPKVMEQGEQTQVAKDMDWLAGSAAVFDERGGGESEAEAEDDGGKGALTGDW